MWLAIGLILGIVLTGLVIWLRGKNISLKWYEWIVAVIGLVLLMFTIQNITAAFDELVPSAAGMFLLVTGLPAVILLAAVSLLTWRRHRAIS